MDVLVNNAGLGIWGPFADSDREAVLRMLRVDVLALTELTHLAVGAMRDRGRGWVLQVSSIGAFQPSPLYAAYSAAKSYVQNFGEALAHELRGTGVQVCVLAPGVTRTEFLEVAGQKPNLYQRTVMMESRPVARLGLDALFRGRRAAVPGIGNRLTAFSMRVLPRRLQARMADMVMQ